MKSDILFLAVTVAVWTAIAVFAVASVYTASTIGIIFGFVAIVVCAGTWAKVTRYWIEARYEVKEKTSLARLEEEIKRLREAIDKLRESLEA